MHFHLYLLFIYSYVQNYDIIPISIVPYKLLFGVHGCDRSGWSQAFHMQSPEFHSCTVPHTSAARYGLTVFRIKHHHKWMPQQLKTKVCFLSILNVNSFLMSSLDLIALSVYIFIKLVPLDIPYFLLPPLSPILPECL